MNDHVGSRLVEVNEGMDRRLGQLEISLGNNEEKLMQLDIEEENEKEFWENKMLNVKNNEGNVCGRWWKLLVRLSFQKCIYWEYRRKENFERKKKHCQRKNWKIL